MDITFTRGEKHLYTTEALRDDGVRLQIPSYDRTSPLPHDLAHYIVERELGLKRGFWGCVAAGALFPGIVVLSGRQPPHAAARSQTVIREAGQQGTEAEVLVGALLDLMHRSLENDWLRARAVLAEVWKPDRPARALPDADEVRRICTTLREIQRRWQALEAGQSLTVTWPSEKRSKR